MAKTTFSSGVVISSKFLNGAQQIHFDGLDEDWHYPPLTFDQVKLSGEGGFDQAFVTLATSQNVVAPKDFSGEVVFSGLDVPEGQVPLTTTGNNDFWDTLVGSITANLNSLGAGVVTGFILNDAISVIDGGEIV